MTGYCKSCHNKAFRIILGSGTITIDCRNIKTHCITIVVRGTHLVIGLERGAGAGGVDAGLGHVAVRGDVLERAEALLHARHPFAVRPARETETERSGLEL